MYYIYFLYSEKSDIYSIGYTSDYQRRFHQHNYSERDTFSSKHRLWQMKAVFECGTDRAAAMKIEKFIKNMKSRVFIEKIISGDELYGILAQLPARKPKAGGVRVPHIRD